MADNEQDRREAAANAALDKALGALRTDVEPSRDLWPMIRAGIEASPAEMSTTDLTLEATKRRKPAFGLWMQLAAGFALVIASAATTYVVTSRSLQRDAVISTAATLPPVAGTTVSETDGAAIAAEYLRSRAELDRMFAQRIAALPPTTRAKLESNLADLRRAADEIVASLSAHPSDPLLHELLMSTYQSEAQLLADVSAMSPADSQRNPS
jgi:hypothetical protein